MNKLFSILTLLAIQLNAFSQIDEKLMDKSVRPQDDIYYHVNGTWMKTTEIPEDKTRWGSFDLLGENTDVATLNLLNSLLKKDYKKGSEEQKIKDLYQSILDFNSRNKQGLSPLKPYLTQIDQIKNLQDLQKYLTSVSSQGLNPFFGFWVDNHMKNSKMNAVYLYDFDMGMGRDYYQKNDEKSKETLASYSEYIQKLYKLLNPKSTKKFGDEYVALEREVAKNLLTLENIRNSELQYNPVAVKDLKNMVKNVDLETYLNQINVKTDTVIIGEINYYKNLDNIINAKNLPLLKDFLKVDLLRNSMSELTQAMDQMQFDFYGKKLSGQKVQRDIHKRALGTINGTFGEVLGKVYVKEAFPPAAKEDAVLLVDYLKKSFKQHIENLSWMSAETKTKALEKLSKFTVKIGYPDKWKDYSQVNIKSVKDGGSYFSNLLEYRKWRNQEMLNKIGKPVDKTEWGMNPQTVNAYYNPQNNEIVFPAAILQAPFYDFKSNPAINFGGIGAVIGHEISHGFDDGGSQYDGDGNLNNWWTEEDKKQFEKATTALADQYSKYEPLPGVFVNGKFTLGENIADLGGVSVAIDAMKMYMKDYPNSIKVKSNYTPEQEFFMSWATVWRTKVREAELKNRVKTDPHSPGYFRAIGPLVNVEEFYKTFDVKSTDKMFKEPAQRITIW